MGELVDLSVVIPIKGHEATIVSTVRSVLAQEFSGTLEVIVVIDKQNSSYKALEETFADPRLRLVAPTLTFPLKGRDSNWRRGLGLKAARGSFLALTDADMVFEADWVETGIRLLKEHELQCVAGTMHRAKEGFWARYIDTNIFGAKTPRFQKSYLLTKENFGLPGSKPGVTANVFFTRDLYEAVGPPPIEFIHSYQDYSFFWRIVSAGYSVLCTSEIIGDHFHRRHPRALLWEYWMSGRGCADFAYAYPDSPLSKLRIAEVLVFWLLVAAVIAGLILVPLWSIAAMALGMLLLGIWSAGKLRSFAGLLYPVVTLVLGGSFSLACTYGLLFDSTQEVQEDYGTQSVEEKRGVKL